MTPDEMFRAAFEAEDMRSHLYRLRYLASQHWNVTEFGVRSGASTIALLRGNSNSVLSYDIEQCPNEDYIKAVFPEWEFRIGDTLEIDIDTTDMLFIDTLHTETQLAAELARHHEQVMSTIALHDMYCQQLDGVNDPAGMWRALEAFLAGHPEWQIVFDEPEGNGLTVLGRMT